MNTKKIIKLLALLMLTAIAFTTLAACGEETPDTPPCTEHNDVDGNGKCDSCDADVKKPDTPPSEPVEVYIIEKGKDCEYVIIHSSSGGMDAYKVNELFKEKTTATKIDMRDDTNAEAEKEILIGDTNRQLSKDLKADCEEKYADDSHVWGFAYRDGKFAFYFNTKTALSKGIEQIEELFLSKRSFKLMSNTWITGEYTAAEYEADKKAEQDRINAEEEAKKQAEYDARTAEAKKLLAQFTDAEFGVTGNWMQDYSMPSGDYTPPKTSITESHPRIFLTKDTIPKIKALLEDSEYKGMVARLWELADSKNFTGEFKTQEHSNGETYAYSSTILQQIEARAMAYLLTGQECYGYEAIMGIKNAMLTLKFTPENHADVYHGPSHVMFMLAEVYDWCYDLLTEQDKAQLISGCVYLLIEAKHLTDDDFVLEKNKPSVKEAKSGIGYGLEFDFPPNNKNALTGHGIGPQFLRDYMMVTVAFADEMPSWWQYVGGRFYEEYVPSVDELYKGGNVFQGTSTYLYLKLSCTLIPAYIVELATGEYPYGEDFAKTFDFVVSHLMPNGNLFETGDGSRKSEGSLVVHCYFYYYAAMYNNTYALTAAKYYSDNYTWFQVDSVTTVGAPLAMALCAACDGKASGSYPNDSDLIYHIGEPNGQTIARNSWEDDAAVVFMKIGDKTLAAHDQMDAGTFQIYYKGLLACTSGSYQLYGSEHHKFYLQSTISLNGLLIYNPLTARDHLYNGWYSGSQLRHNPPTELDQIVEDSEYDVADVTGMENAYNGDGAHYAYIAGDITNAYGKETVTEVERRMLTVYTGNESFPMIFFIYDNITSRDADFKKSFLLHTVNEPTVGTDKNGQHYAIVTAGDGKLVLTNVAGGDHIYKIGGEGYSYWIGNENEFDGTIESGRNLLDGNPGTDNSDIIWGRVEITARGEKTTQMLNTMYVTDADNTETLESVKIENATVLGVTVGGNITAIFVKESARANGEFSFTATGDESMKYYVSGVEAGTWDIYANGVKVGSDEATEDGGFLYFEAAAGEITLKPCDP